MSKKYFYFLTHTIILTGKNPNDSAGYTSA